jgi:DNA polymerase III delta subunit
MIYLFLGEDRQAKDQKIAEIKSQCLSSDDARKLDAEVLYAEKLDPAVLKKALIALPAVAEKRYILIHTPEKLTPQNKDIILDYIQTGSSHAVVILDSDESAPKNNFFATVMAAAKVVRFGQKVKKNVFDVTRALDNCDLPEALKILDNLMEEGDNPLQILGGLVWFWGRTKGRTAADCFKKGLLVLQEADVNIKRSRVMPEHAVEIAVTKLSLLIVG